MDTFNRTYNASNDHLGFDLYREMAQTRAAAQASVAFQALQTGLLSQMSGSMNGIHAEMAEARQQQGETLAIQQELLNREEIQSHLEEFIFQAEKLVAECSTTTTDIPASSRYFLLMGVLDKIQQDGIGTPIIRGRDNKAAFDKVLAETNGLTQRLRKEPEVQQAIKWAEAEQQRLEDNRLKSEQERQAKVQELERRLSDLQANLVTISFVDELKHECEFITKRVSVKPEHKVPLIVGAVVLGMFLLPLLPFMLILALIFSFFVYLGAKERATKLNRETNEQIGVVMQQLATLQSEADE